MAIRENHLQVLLVEDDEDDYIVTRDILNDIAGSRILLDWADNAELALKMLRNKKYDVFLLDYRLGSHDGIELLKMIRKEKFDQPAIMLTGAQDSDIDMMARNAGAYDYLEKGKIDSLTLGRSINFAIDHVRTIEELKKSERALLQSEAKRRLQMEQTPLGIIEWSTNLRVTGWNPAASAIFGYSKSDVIGELVLDLIVPEEDRATDVAHWRSMVSKKEVTNFSRLNCRKDGGNVICEWINVPVVDERGEVLGVVSYVQDVTVRIRMEEALKKAKDDADAANRSKSEFLAGMSHEIRTPMNAILGMAELLSESSLSPEQREYVRRFRRAGDALLSIINDILDFSKVEAGIIEMENIPFDLSEFLDDIMETMGDPARDKGLELICHVGKDVPVWLKGDPLRIRQILINLIGNAIKFTAEGEINLGIELIECSNLPLKDETKLGDCTLLLSVRDTGLGIPMEKMGLIFESFTQADTSTTRKYGGTGLGLAICKKMAELLGGKIWVDSKEGVGSTFHVMVPLQVRGRGEESSQSANISLEGLRVLVVDDNMTNRMILNDGLGGAGALVLEAKGGKEALEMLISAGKEGQPYDLVLLDNFMPGMDGLDMMGHLSDGGMVLSSTSFVLLSSINYYSDIPNLKKLGISACLMKPVRIAEVVKTVSRILGRHELLKARNADNVSTEMLHILLVDDSEDNRLLIDNFLGKTIHRMDMAENGQEAFNMFISQAYDLVFMDMQMPVLDGYDATSKIREWERDNGRNETPIVALTAYAMKEEIGKSLDAGCNEHMSKPIAKKDLLETISRYAAKKEKQIGAANG